MDRKKFIISTSLTAFSLSTFGSILQDAQGEFKGDCETTNDILGPYYRPDAPFRDNLTYPGLLGTKILLKGKVLKQDCITPLKKALVEIWHCSSASEYDNDSKEFRHRASLYTNEQGEYSFATILPGKY